VDNFFLENQVFLVVCLDIHRASVVLMIAHRLPTVQDADNTVVVDNGKIAEQGTYKELMTK
jgi:ABC-type multidrug transport system fused ATPase/permease subunit